MNDELQKICAEIGMYVASETDAEIRRKVFEIEGRPMQDEEMIPHLTNLRWENMPPEITVYAWKGVPIVKIDSSKFYRFEDGRFEWGTRIG